MNIIYCAVLSSQVQLQKWSDLKLRLSFSMSVLQKKKHIFSTSDVDWNNCLFWSSLEGHPNKDVF